MYTELHSRSAFSFLEGSSLPEDLVAACARLNLAAMALLDTDGVYGAPRFHQAAKKAKLKAHIGAEVTCGSLHPVITCSSPHSVILSGVSASRSEALAESKDPYPRQSAKGIGIPRFARNDNAFCLPAFRLPLLISSRAGYQNLCRLITKMKMRAKKNAGPVHQKVLTEELEEHAPGLICLTGGAEGPLAAALQQGGTDEGRRQVEHLIAIFGHKNVYVELQRHYQREEESRNRAAISIARSLNLPILATNGVCYAAAKNRELCDAFTAIRHHHTLSTTGRLLSRNSERFLKSAQEMQQLFSDFPEAIANTGELSSRLEFTLNDLGYEFPRYPIPEGETMNSFLHHHAWAGFHQRYGRAELDLQTRARNQIEKELKLIEKLNLAGYFLIVWDLVRFCREQNILMQGRGSAANSAVCYSLGITAVDAVGMELLFERFLSEERGEWPDIDLDLPSGDEREKVIQYVYQRYGERGAAMTANVITYRNRMAAREMGKVLGFDPETLNKISAAVATWEFRDENDALDRRFRDAGLDLNHPRLRKYYELCLAVQDMPRHLGQHSGGMVICQGQLDSVVPLEPASMPGRVVVQWDKEDCADMGIIKVDLLGLGMMAVLKDSIELIREHHHEEVDLAHLPQDDSQVYSALQQADTVGLFQVESRAQMASLPRLRPKNFYDIVVQVAIIRPGPIVGQMVNPFIQRRQGREDVTYPHPSLEPVLKRTLGVPLFQEQLLRLAMIAANFTGGEAEDLRRAMGFKRSLARMKEIEARLRSGMTQNKIPHDAQEEIILSITSFALYGFPESHAASFALIAYASAYLKCHYLAAFTAALLNNQPMGFYSPATLVKDAQRHGLKLLPVDVTCSEWKCTLEKAISHELSALSETVLEPVPCPHYPVPRKTLVIPTPERMRGAEESRSCSQLGTRDPQPTSPALRLGLRYVRGLREDAAQALLRERRRTPFTSIHDLTRRVPELRKDELTTLAEIGALNRIGLQIEDFRFQISNPDQSNQGQLNHNHSDNDQSEIYNLKSKISLNGVGDSPRRHRDTENKTALQSTIKNQQSTISSVPPWLRGENKFHRRDALWQVERAVRGSGPLLEKLPEPDTPSPLEPMNHEERLVADFHGTGLTVGPHPVAYRRAWLTAMGIRRASELRDLPSGKRLRIGGCVIVRQRPGTAKGFVFVSLEDETGVANAIITPDLFHRHRLLLASEKFLAIEGILQNQDNVISVKAERVMPLFVTKAETVSHDFH
jgi:error-prone DNA polymerase